MYVRANMLSRIILLVALVAPLSTLADSFVSAANRHGIDPYLFKAIAQVESDRYPWTLNLDGEPLRFKNHSDVVSYYRYAKSRPVMLRTVRGGTYHYQWFESAVEAEQEYLAARRHNQRSGGAGGDLPILRVINPDNVDVGIMQVNWQVHRKLVGVSFEKLLDPSVNMDYAGRYLAGLIRAHGLWEGVGRYHSPSPTRRKAYTAKVWRAYRQIVSTSTRRASTVSEPNG